MKFCYSILLGVLFVVCGCATGVDEAKAKEPAATVNGRVLTYGELDMLLAAVPANARVNRNEIRSQLVHQFVTQNALAAAAKKAGLELTSSDINFGKAKLQVGYCGRDGYEGFLDRYPLGRDAAKEYFENGLLVDKYFSSELAKVPEVRQEAERIIASVKADNANNGGAGAALEKIKALKKELDACTPSEVDAKFAELARANSECPSSRKGGDLGFFGHGMMVKEFDEAAFTLRPGIVSDPVKTTFGYHLILVTDKKDDQVKASHILIKCGEKPVPTLEEAMSVNVNSAAASLTRLLVQQALQASKIVLADEFRGLFAFAGIR